MKQYIVEIIIFILLIASVLFFYIYGDTAHSHNAKHIHESNHTHE